MKVTVQQVGKRLWIIYLLVTLGLLLALTSVLMAYGSVGYFIFQRPGAGSSLWINFAAFCISWLFIGFILCLSQFPVFVRRHIVFLFVFVFLGFAYLNIFREPHQIIEGDFRAYFLAAVDMSKGQPIEQTRDRLYLYPPLLATVLSLFVWVGRLALGEIFHLLNYAGVLLLMLLLYLALQKYRFSRELAAVTVGCVLVVNVPLLRTLIYHQINLQAVNLMLLSLLFAEKRNVWSALTLSLAVHLKVYPIVLVLPFLYLKRWRWCVWFVVCQAIIVGTTSVINSPQYYVQFFQQVTAITEIAQRNVSVDTFIYNTLRYMPPAVRAWENTIAHALRILLGTWILIIYFRLLRRHVFINETATNAPILNSYVIFPVLMLVISPSIWPAHFLFWMLTMPVLLSELREPLEYWLYLLAYVFIFLFPAYDIYPVSYLRFVGLLIVIYLLQAVAKHTSDTMPQWWGALQARLTQVLGPSSSPMQPTAAG